MSYMYVAFIYSLNNSATNWSIQMIQFPIINVTD